MSSNQRLKVHKPISHIFILRLEQILYLIQSKQLRYVFIVLCSHYALLSRILLESFLLLFLVYHLRMMQQKAFQEKMLNFKHIHLGFASNDFSRSIILVLRDPVFRKTIVKHTNFRQTKPQFPWILFPKDKLVNQLQICLFMMVRMVTLWFKIVISFHYNAIILVEAYSFANRASTSFVIELMILRFVSKLRSRHIIFIVRANINNFTNDGMLKSRL